MLTVTITIATIGTDAANFSLYSNVDGFTTPFETGISRAALLAGYTSVLVPNGTTIIRVQSTGICTNYIDGTFGLTTTTTTTTTSTTAAPTTTTTTTTTTSTTTSVYTLGIQWRIASSTFAAGELAYSTNGGSTWTVNNANIGLGGIYITARNIIVSNGMTILIAVRNLSSANVTFGTGAGGSYTGHCGESTPYSVTISSPTTDVYLNISESSAGVLQTC